LGMFNSGGLQVLKEKKMEQETENCLEAWGGKTKEKVGESIGKGWANGTIQSIQQQRKEQKKAGD